MSGTSPRSCLTAAVVTLACIVVSAQAAGGSEAHATAPSQIRSLGNIRLAHRWSQVGHLALVPHGLVFAACAGCGRAAPPDRLVELNLRTRQERVVVRSAWRHGMTDWAESSGNWLVYTDQNHEQSDNTGIYAVKWTLSALNLRTGATRLLDSSHGRPRPDVPLPRAGSGRVVWTVRDPAHPGYGVLKQARIARGRATVVRRRCPPVVDTGITAGHVVYATSAGAVWSVGPNGADRRRLFRRYRAVDDVRAGGGYAVWTEVRRPHDPTAFRDPPYARVRPVDGSRPAQLVQRGGRIYELAVGSGFAAWLNDTNSSQRIEAVGLATGTKMPIADTNRFWVPGAIAARGHRLAYATYTHPSAARPTITVHLNNISPA